MSLAVDAKITSSTDNNVDSFTSENTGGSFGSTMTDEDNIWNNSYLDKVQQGNLPPNFDALYKHLPEFGTPADTSALQAQATASTESDVVGPIQAARTPSAEENEQICSFKTAETDDGHVGNFLPYLQGEPNWTAAALPELAHQNNAASQEGQPPMDPNWIDPHMPWTCCVNPYSMPYNNMACNALVTPFPTGEQAQGTREARNRGRRKSSKLSSEIPDEEKTSIMLQNIPNNNTPDDIVELLNTLGFKGNYDFFYLPYDFTRVAGLGYAFINFVTHKEAVRAWDVFNNFKFSQWSQKICCVNWGDLQGLEAHIERYKSSPVMHPSVPLAYKPMLYDKNGNQLPFPKPLKPPPKPRCKNGNNVLATFSMHQQEAFVDSEIITFGEGPVPVGGG